MTSDWISSGRVRGVGRAVLAAAVLSACGGVWVEEAGADDNTRRGLVRPGGGGGGGGGGGQQNQPRREDPPAQQPSSQPPPVQQRPSAQPPASAGPGSGGSDGTRRGLVRPGNPPVPRVPPIDLPSGVDTARGVRRSMGTLPPPTVQTRDNTQRDLVKGRTNRPNDRWNDDRWDRGRDRDRWRNDRWRRDSYHHHGYDSWRNDWHDDGYGYSYGSYPTIGYFDRYDAFGTYHWPSYSVYNYSKPVTTYSIGYFSDSSRWWDLSWGVWSGTTYRYPSGSYWQYGWSSFGPGSSTWCGHVWDWHRPVYYTDFTVIDRFEYAPPVTIGQVSPGVTQETPALDGLSETAKEAIRAEQRLLSRINRGYNVEPDFLASVDGTLENEYSASIYAMRRAAGVNPEAMVGAASRVGRLVNSDPNLAQRVRFARAVYQNPPQRVVSEVDARFMVAALSAALGEVDAAERAIAEAKVAGDAHSSTQLLHRAIRGDDLGNGNPWVPGTPLNR